MMKLSLLWLLLLLLIGSQQRSVLGKPLAPTTLDGATPIDAQVSAADFGALDAFAEDAAEGSPESSQSASEAGFKISLLPTPSKTAESVNLEHEGIPSKVLSTYDNSQKKIADISHPVPILDSISEHEKYGNNGDKFDAISRSLVNGYEAFSNLLNSFIQKPKEIARTVSKGITAQLDIIGGKLVGL
ncbi:GH24849 [Drosophila grimshawi]|uniref:GH24849 n=2 Tax=Drosophila grimshawi TaxID=7222 RepID=B4JNM6_DROGR|nr:GH24849 [Drosophila grimshawi]